MSKKAKLSNSLYEQELQRLQHELVHMQRWVKTTGARVVIVFEGRDAAGKGGAIKRITELLNPRSCRVVALPVPTEKEKTQWYFQRYIQHLPSAGEIVLFDRSWYNRAGVEKVMGFCTDEQYSYFMRACPEFEALLIRDGITLLKYWFSVSEEEQEKRFKSRINEPTKRWKISPMDMQSRQHWVDYSRAKDTMLKYTDTKLSPWYIVDSDDKKKARLNCISHILSQIPYEHYEIPALELAPLQDDDTYLRPPVHEQSWVPDIATELAKKYEKKCKKDKKKKKGKKDKAHKDPHDNEFDNEQYVPFECSENADPHYFDEDDNEEEFEDRLRDDDEEDYPINQEEDSSSDEIPDENNSENSDENFDEDEEWEIPEAPHYEEHSDYEVLNSDPHSAEDHRF
ncbi:MAG: polyphosphate kinase 2 [Christensenellaceae bacterium]|nr:polyphosphate kinase 2 [Christensenellaceae bacterium]